MASSRPPVSIRNRNRIRMERTRKMMAALGGDDSLDEVADHFFDRAGQPISYRRYAELKSDDHYHRVGTDTVGSSWISTVWLGINYEWRKERLPIIYETMIFDGPLDTTTERYSTEDKARVGHARWIKIVRIIDRRRRARRYKHKQPEQRRRHRSG